MIDKFVEIEINSTNTKSIPNKAIPTSVYDDPIREKFYDMRDLADNKNNWIKYSTFTDEKLFYKQAKFMENFTDNYEKTADLYMDTPCYQRMGYEQLRTYFTWRTRARGGEISGHKSMSYVLLYIYEILLGIGVDNPVDGLEKLMTLWKTFGDHEFDYSFEFDKYLPQWILDYHIYYPLPHSIEDFICEHSLQKYYSLAFHSNHTRHISEFEVWDKLSDYHIEKSIFCKDNPENIQLIINCFLTVINAIRELCNSKDISIAELLYYKRDWLIEWTPFRSAIFYPWLKQPEHSITLADGSTYHHKTNKWHQEAAVPHEYYKNIVTYFIKKTESCVRQHANFKRKITADIKYLTPEYSPHLVKLNIKPSEFEDTIETAVSQYFKSLSHIEVRVDIQNLARIRDEAQTTQDKLVVPESDFTDSIPSNENQDRALNHLPVIINESEQQQEKDAWAQLKESLTDIEKQALTILLNDDDIALFASEHNIMLEILTDNINEKATDYIGDCIIDDSMEIYDEYKNFII